MRFEPATAARVQEYHTGEIPVSFRGFVVLNDLDEVVGMAGFVRKSVGVRCVFSEGKEEAYTDKRMMVRLARTMMKIADDNGWTLLAEADPTIPTAPHFLGLLGFEPDDEGVYTRWHGR